MDAREILEMFGNLFTDYSIHIKFLEETKELLKKDLRGKQGPFFQGLSTQLNNIKTLGCMVYKADNNEILKGEDGHYYSIHVENRQFNVRMLVYILSNGKPYFLCCFNEREGKRKTDYTAYTKVMRQRLKQLMEDEQNE